MKQDRSIRETYQLNVQLLTPVHIGCGKNYVQDIDYIKSGQKVSVFDQNKLFAEVAALGETAVNEFTAAVEEQQVHSFLREKKINLNSITLYSFSWSTENRLARMPRDIRRYIRDGLGRPLIPGSSLKGLFRSAILSRLNEENKNREVKKLVEKIKVSSQSKKRSDLNPKYAADPVLHALLGKDAKYNLMRSLTVSDCVLPSNAVQVDEAYVTSLETGATRFKRKKWSMLIEQVRPGECAIGQISFDRFLQEQAQGKAVFNFQTTLNRDWLVQALRQRTSRFLDAERKFLHDKNGDGVKQLQQFYNQLQRQIEQLKDNEAIAQFAWGSGWQGMTGALLAPDDLTRDVRTALQLAKHRLNFPFPKSRRLSGGDEAAKPIGWVKLSFISSENNDPPQEEDPTATVRKSLEKMNIIQNWDQLKRAASDLNKENNEKEDAVAKAFKEAALRVKANYPDKWTPERDSQVKAWLAPAGLTWTDSTTADPVEEEPSGSPNRITEAAFKDYGDWLNRHQDFQINELNQAEATALLTLFKDWNLDNNKSWRKTPAKKEWWQEVRKRIQQLKKTG
ncbi:type III-A CRISPR-associated RAMP protein Csm5 [Desulfobulbus oligotrophicus]|uniref:CRISPR system Cms protein Csm5 n=1 Tax=Desulfobulbus oligotrophicus TaxID=1909699 RepID=A0A7T5VER4_9BACT|nr:type III-A CRISPR-associated RAMP protein Csm5 [Desulfobulbus oligotrophicus]QQG66595.1 type III-A CRISPR-associated RAMP protein Csm5 [Desulfobulbus oligotrophicus]